MFILHQSTVTGLTKSFTKALQYIHLSLATLQSVVAAATNNLAQFDCL